MDKNYVIVIGVLFQFISISAVAGENWKVIIADDPVSKTSRCLMESKTQVTEDGQTKTYVKLVYTGTGLYAATKSHIDLTYPGVGLQVDSNPQLKIDKLVKEKTAVFVKDISIIHKQFIHGAKAKLALGFWPTWPKTKTRIIEFSLFGYTKAYQQFQKCNKTGKL